MTDTTKPQIDLSTLKQGDAVVFADGQKALVNHICDNGYGGLKIYMFIECDSNKQPLQFEDDYQDDGQVQFHNTHENDIVEIIKNPRRWDDSDMKAAFEAGKPTLESLFKHDLKFDVWLEHYKQVKQ